MEECISIICYQVNLCYVSHGKISVRQWTVIVEWIMFNDKQQKIPSKQSFIVLLWRLCKSLLTFYYSSIYFFLSLCCCWIWLDGGVYGLSYNCKYEILFILLFTIPNIENIISTVLYSYLR